jgi:hypothetical protein
MTEPSIVGDMALFGFATRPRGGGTASPSGGLLAIETETGNLVWQIEATPIRSAPAAIDGMIFVMGGSRPQGDAAGGNLLAFAAE